MTTPGDKPIPTDAVTREEFNQQDERRRHSHVLSYGSGWQEPGWTDSSHVIEVMWFAATHEIVAYYITYDWDRLGPGKLTRDAVGASAMEIVGDVGSGIGRMLGDLDIARSDVHVRLLGAVDNDLRCHELLWDWRWMQHHPDGFAHIIDRINKHQPHT